MRPAIYISDSLEYNVCVCTSVVRCQRINGKM